MITLEEQLRDVLQQRATMPRLGEDVAGTAIRGARRLRRQRFTAVAVATAFALLALAGGIGLTRPAAAPLTPASGGPSPTPSVTASPAGPTPAVLFGINADVLAYDTHTLFATDGTTYDLGPDPISAVVRVPAGWLYGHANGGPPILLHPDGTRLELSGIDNAKVNGQFFAGPAISADGERLAWVEGTTLHAATLAADGLHDGVTSPTLADTFAQTWIGSRVVVGQSYGTGCCGYRPAQYDVWDPAKGVFVPHWTKELWPVYGPEPDGAPTYAMTHSNPTSAAGCLGRVDGVAGMTVADTICLDGLDYESLMGRLSPDGRYLAELAGGDHIAVIDLHTVGETHFTASTCPADEVVVWESSTSFVAIDSARTRVIRCTLTSNVEPISTTPAEFSANQLRPVPRLGL
jgi:hypothetical protein